VKEAKEFQRALENHRRCRKVEMLEEQQLIKQISILKEDKQQHLNFHNLKYSGKLLRFWCERALGILLKRFQTVVEDRDFVDQRN
jgi:lantibiotic modifying enzyme